MTSRGQWWGVWVGVGIGVTLLVSCDEGETGVTPPEDGAQTGAGTDVTSSATSRDPSTSSDVRATLASGATSESADTATSDATWGGVESTPLGATSDGASSGAGTESGEVSGGLDTCPKTPPLPQGADGLVAIPFTVVSGAEPLEPNTETLTAEGIPYHISLLGLFLSQPRFERENGELVDAAFVDERGAPVPYGLFYYLSSSPSRLWNLAAPNGDYVALHVELGVPADCMQKIGDEPLSPSSQMYWSWGATFMALRMEGMVREADAGAEQFMYHLGPLPGAPLNKTSIRVAGEWSVGEAVTSETAIELDLAHVFAPRPADQTIAGHPLVAEWVITNLVDTAFRAAN